MSIHKNGITYYQHININITLSLLHKDQFILHYVYIIINPYAPTPSPPLSSQDPVSCFRCERMLFHNLQEPTAPINPHNDDNEYNNNHSKNADD